MSEQIVTGKKYKILADATNKVWHVISFISQAVDVVFTNGKNAQTTLGSITGISDSLTSTSSNVAASAASVKALNDKITELSSNLGCNLGSVSKSINGTGNTSVTTSATANITKSGYAVISTAGYSQYNGVNMSITVKVNGNTPTELTQQYDINDGQIWGRAIGYTCKVKKGDTVTVNLSVSGSNVSGSVAIVNIGL